MSDEKEIITLEEIDCRDRELSALLLDRIAKRDEMKSLLKIAKPAKIAPIREVVARFDKIIGMIENELDLNQQMRRKRIEIDENEQMAFAKMEKMKPEFLEFIAENHPEKLEEMELLLSGEDTIRTH